MDTSEGRRDYEVEKRPAPSSSEASAALSLSGLVPVVGAHAVRTLPSVHGPASRSASTPTQASDASMRSQLQSRSRSAERFSRSRAAPDAAATPVLSRKRNKHEPSEYAPRIAELEREIATVKAALEAPATPALVQARKLVAECLEMKQRAAFLNKKLMEHSHWAQRVSSLMESAPLIEIACVLPASAAADKRQSAPRPPVAEEPGLTLSFLDEWRRSSAREPLTRFILKERLKVIVDRSAERASGLVQSYGLAPKALVLFPLQMESRGWHLATGAMVDTSIAFRCERLLPPSAADKAKEIAAELWQSVVRDEVQRTFMPIVQEAALAYEDGDCCLWHHSLQFSTSPTVRAVATVGSLQTLRSSQQDQRDEWQIAIETAQDNYLYTFASDMAGENGNGLSPRSGSPSSGPASPLSALDFGSSIRKCSMSNNFVIGLRVTVTDAGVRLLIVGSAVFDLHHVRDPALELLQYLVSYLPIYEELYLQQFVTT